MRFAIGVCAALFLALHTASAQQTDIIRGRVTGPDSLPAQDVEVRATSYGGNVTKTTKTGKDGRYTIIFNSGEGDYWLDFRKLGLAPKRFELKRIGDEEILIADTRLTSTIAQLDAVNVTAQRDRALPNRNSNPDVGGGERPLTNNNVLVSPDQAGNLAAMAAAVAGIQMLPGFDGASDMFSLLGLTGDQNSVVFNGLGSAISALPPDILASTSIVPYSFDPAKGGFSGAQISIQTLPGSNFSRRAMSSFGIAPPLEWTDATSAAQGQKYSSVRLRGNAAGPITMDQFFYNTAYNFQRRFSDAHTLFSTDPAGLLAAGVSADSVARLHSILSQQGLSFAADAPRVQAQDLAQLSGNLDLSPSSSGTGNSFILSGVGNLQRSEPVSRGGLLLAAPSHAGEAQNWNTNVALQHSNYFGFGVLSKTTVGMAISGQQSLPYSNMPEGSVRVASTLDNGTSSVKPLLFGGSSSRSSQRDVAVQVLNQMSWFSADNRHTIKVTSGVDHDTYRSDAAPSVFGTYAFNSLQDLEGGQASSFTRTIGVRRQSAAQIEGHASLGDYWRPSENVQVQYGLRADANHFLSTPEENPALEALGVRNDVAPNALYLSPRVGLQWYYGKAPTIAFIPGAARPPRAVVHAGIGVFQNLASAQVLAPATLATGLSSSSQTVTCLGSSVPSPSWSSFLADPSTIPARCADGSVNPVFSSVSPNVTLFDRSFRQPRSIRGAGDWSGPVWDNRFVLGVQGIVSAGLAQSGLVDANLDDTPRFQLANEGGRPVFVDPSAIVPATGAVAALGSRRDAAFQHVSVSRSDLRVDARQLTVNLKPITANAYFKWDLTYTLLDRYEKVSGFTSTSGDPYSSYWSPTTLGGRHTGMLQWRDVPIFDLMYLTTGVVVESGQRFTPAIAGDVNGDGYLNDRAFVFDPAHAPDTSIASAMRSLLERGDNSARDCLRRQLGQLASRASCHGPWTGNAVMQLKFNPQKIGLPKRLAATLTLQNPLALADIIAHGANDVHGWGQNIAPDQNLLFIRGFDPATRQFKYDVNQRFGSTRPQESTTHALPFLSFGFSLDIGATRERQLLTQRLDMGRTRPGTKPNAEALKLIGTTTIPNPMRLIVDAQDSLRLTRIQADSLATLSYAFAIFADSVWTPVSRELMALPDNYDHGDAYARYVKARERTIDFLLTLAPAAKAILTPSQRRKLPTQISNYLDERVLRFLRSSSAGDGSVVSHP
jgi:hypothetical protein